MEDHSVDTLKYTKSQMPEATDAGNIRQQPLERLRNKWQVKNVLQVVLILCTFAIGGSLCGYLGRSILNLTGLNGGVLWIISYLVLVTLLWPVCVLAISVFFGQFSFFKGYIMRLGARMFGKKSKN